MERNQITIPESSAEAEKGMTYENFRNWVEANRGTFRSYQARYGFKKDLPADFLEKHPNADIITVDGQEVIAENISEAVIEGFGMIKFYGNGKGDINGQPDFDLKEVDPENVIASLIRMRNRGQ